MDVLITSEEQLIELSKRTKDIWRPLNSQFILRVCQCAITTCNDMSVSAIDRFNASIFLGICSGLQRFTPAIDGNHVNIIREVALSFLDEKQRKLVNHVPVYLIPIPLFNSEVVNLNGGNIAIILNSAIMVSMQCLSMLFYGHIRKVNMLRLNDTDMRSVLDFVRAVNFLTATSKTGDASFADTSTIFFPIAAERNDPTFKFNIGIDMLLYALLHEYGHIIKKHISANNIIQKNLCMEKNITAFSKNIEEEYEADDFAIGIVCNHLENQKERNVVAQQLYLMYSFFDLIELMLKKDNSDLCDTHPPALKRWDRVRDMLSVSLNDYYFDFESDFKKMEMLFSVNRKWLMGEL